MNRNIILIGNFTPEEIRAAIEGAGAGVTVPPPPPVHIDRNLDALVNTLADELEIPTTESYGEIGRKLGTEERLEKLVALAQQAQESERIAAELDVLRDLITEHATSAGVPTHTNADPNNMHRPLSTAERLEALGRLARVGATRDLPGVRVIAAERHRQIGKGYDRQHDALNETADTLALAAAVKLLVKAGMWGEWRELLTKLWPWPNVNPGGNQWGTRELLAEAGALCAAAIDLHDHHNAGHPPAPADTTKTTT